MGKLQNFVITLGNPAGVYYAGQIVDGFVDVLLSEPMEMRRITLKLLGKAKVSWSAGSSKSRRHYRADELYFQNEIDVVGSAAEQIVLQPGLHRYPFRVVLPRELPSSFESNFGYVRYKVEANIDRAWKFDDQTRLPFTVVSILDLNNEPPCLKAPFTAQHESTVSCCSCASGDVYAAVTVNRLVFVPGETIFISAEIQNRSTGNINSSKAVLMQVVQYQGYRDAYFASGDLKSYQVSSKIATIKKQEKIPAGSTGNWSNVPLVIPPVAPSKLEGCSYINIGYQLKFSTDLGFETEIGITIGTVPLLESYPAVANRPTTSSGDGTRVDMMNAVVPPSYEECIGGRVTMREEGDNSFVHGDVKWAPKYPTYRQLSQS